MCMIKFKFFQFIATPHDVYVQRHLSHQKSYLASSGVSKKPSIPVSIVWNPASLPFRKLSEFESIPITVVKFYVL
jgi:hypothetical protein